MIDSIDATTGGQNAGQPADSAIRRAPEHVSRNAWHDFDARLEDSKSSRARHWRERKNYVNPRLAVPDRSILVQVVNASPVDCRSLHLSRECFLDWLFPDVERLLCMGRSYQDVKTGYRDDEGMLTGQLNYIVPAYMTAPSGMTAEIPHLGKQSHPSNRCAANTGEPLFLIYRNSTDDLDDQAAMIMRLAQRARLALIVVSAPGVLSAWFSTEGLSKARVKSFRSAAQRLGSDHAASIKCSLHSFPGGSCEKTGHRHEVIYFDPVAFPGGGAHVSSMIAH